MDGSFSPMLFGYLDPGTIMFVMQCFVAVVVGISLSCQIFWTFLKNRVASLFVRNGSKNSMEQPPVGAETVDTQNNDDHRHKAA